MSSTLSDAFGAMSTAPGRGITFAADKGRADVRVEYPAFAAEVRRVAVALGRRVPPGGIVAVISPDCRVQTTVFWAAAAHGRVACILPSPSLLIAPAYFARILPAMLSTLSPACVVTDRPTSGRLASAVTAGTIEPSKLAFWEELAAGRDPALVEPAPVSPSTSCYVQFSSGTSSLPKGVVLTHGSIVANVRALAQRLRVTPSDIGFSWLPLYHDMGLVGGHLLPVVHVMEHVLMRPLSFAARPLAWLERLARSRATMSVAPGFAYDLCLDHAHRGRIPAGLDLSCLRAMLNGSERIRPDGPREFEEAFGLRPGTVLPCYGLAEATLAVTVAEPGAPAVIDHSNDETRHVSVGRPLESVDVRIVGGGPVGEIVVGGPSLAQGYLGVEDSSFFVGADGERGLHTGDLGYLRDGRLFVTGRAKDVLIVRGRNIDPSDLEAAAEGVDGVRAGHTVAFSHLDPASGVELVVLLVETAARGVEGLAEQVRARVGDATGVAPDRVEIVSRGTVSRTTSGKRMRQPARAWYREWSRSR